MKGDLIIKDVDLEQLEKDLKLLKEEFVAFRWAENRRSSLVFDAGKRVSIMLEAWAEGRKAEKEDEELARKIVAENFEGGTDHAKKIYKQGILAGLKEQRKRLGK